MKIIGSVDDALSLVGADLGVSDWRALEQSRIDDFADVTEDHQWIHVDAARAATDSPYGSTIAHGFLSLSMIPSMSKENYRVEGAKMGINYGLNKVRFLSAVTPGSRIRVSSTLLDVATVDHSTMNLTIRHTVEIEHGAKPAVVADLISRYVY